MKLKILLLAVFLASTASARPISYAGGKTVMQMNDADRNSIHLHYSPTAKHSIGYKGSHWRDDDFEVHMLHQNFLLKRWNKPKLQGNLYLKVGTGFAIGDDENSAAGTLGFAADVEDRRFFASYENHGHVAFDIDRRFMQKVRLGVAPYIGSYGDIHTWIMVQGEHSPGQEDNFTVTPLLRFFKGTYLAEIGMDENGKPLFNWIVRY